jgi:hypothetical protein
MRSIVRGVSFVFCLLAFSVAVRSQTETVDTSASAVATYGTTLQSAGPFPWSDLGITASASVTPGVLNVSTGGGTSFTLNSTVTSGESFIPGSTLLNLGYTPSWTGSFTATPPASGNFNSQFVYHIGPFNGSQTLLNVPLSIPSANGNLGSNLNFGLPSLASPSASGPGVSVGFGLQAQVCFIVCGTVASASIHFDVGTEIDQTISMTPSVTYGDLVWESTTPTYSPSDTFTFVPGIGGNIQNTFTAPTGLSLVSGQTFYYNFLPVVELAMPVVNEASVAVPASITASWNIFGAGGSQTWPLGDLYSLGTGPESFGFDPTFYADQFYSIPLEYTLNCPGIACFASYQTPPSSGGPTIQMEGGGPSSTDPCGTLLVTCDLAVPPGPGTVGGFGTDPLGPLFPGDPSTNDICGPIGTPFAGQCINQVNLTQIPSPEPGSLALFATGLSGLALLIKRRRLGRV